MNRSACSVMYVGRIAPHYRRDVFRHLNAMFEEGLFVASGREASGIKTLTKAEYGNLIDISNISIGNFVLQVGVVSWLRTLRPHAVIFEGDIHILSTWFYACLCRAIGIPVAFWTIGWHRRERGVLRLLRNAFYRTANRLLVYGRGGIEIGLEMGFPSQRMTFVGNSISEPLADDEPGPDWERQLERVAEGRVVIAVVRLTEYKRLDLIIQAAGHLLSVGRPIEVLLVGNGPRKRFLQDLAESLGVKLTLPGATYSSTELAQAYSKAGVSVIPNAAGLTTLQSLRFGVPVVTDDSTTTQAPESEAIVDGVTGSRYREGNVIDLARHIDLWLERMSQHPDPVRRACRETVEGVWSAESHARRIGTAIRALVSCKETT